MTRNRKIRARVEALARSHDLHLHESPSGAMCFVYRHPAGGGMGLSSDHDIRANQPQAMLDFLIKEEAYLKSQFAFYQLYFDHCQESNTWSYRKR